MGLGDKPRVRVLVIEDDEGIRKLIREFLEPAYEVHTARDGEEGLEQAPKVRPHLILLDLRMPGMDGLKVLGKLKGNPATVGIPVVIVSARGETDILIEGKKSGAVDHVIKPFTAKDLRDVVGKQFIISSDDPREPGQGPLTG